MTDTAFAICDRALAPGGDAPEWVHLFPAGRMTGRDGRQFDLADPAALIRDFEGRGVDLPIDYEHQNDRPEAKLIGPVPAAGWIKELRADETGLWGRVEWTAPGRAMIAKREYRYVSPSFAYHPQTKAILRLRGAGLVHNPNLHLTALASEESDMPDIEATDTGKSADPAMLAQLAAFVGLPPDSDAQGLLHAIIGLLGKAPATPGTATAVELPDPARFVPIDAVQELLADRNAHIATMRETEAKAKVERALKDGHITSAMRGWATALCTQDPASFDAFIEKSPAPYAHLLRRVKLGPINATGSASAASPEAAAICSQLGIEISALKE